jgi:hypothetical protein
MWATDDLKPQEREFGSTAKLFQARPSPAK